MSVFGIRLWFHDSNKILLQKFDLCFPLAFLDFSDSSCVIAKEKERRKTYGPVNCPFLDRTILFKTDLQVCFNTSITLPCYFFVLVAVNNPKHHWQRPPPRTASYPSSPLQEETAGEIYIYKQSENCLRYHLLSILSPSRVPWSINVENVPEVDNMLGLSGLTHRCCLYSCQRGLR